MLEQLFSQYPIKPGEGLRTYFKRIGSHCDLSMAAVRGRVDRMLKRAGYAGVSKENFDDFYSNIKVSSKGKKKVSLSEDAMVINYEGSKAITSLEEAVEFFDINLVEWKPVSIEYNSWPTTAKNNEGTLIQTMNYQVKVKCQPRLTENQKLAEEWRASVEKLLVDVKELKVSKSKTTGRKVGILTIADFHYGADNKGLTVNKDYDFKVFREHMSIVVNKINSYRYDHVDLNVLGDLIESWSGLNHLSTFRHLGQFGPQAFIQLCEWFAENVIARINNIRSLNVVNGNHDRTSMSAKVDVEGAVGTLFSYVMRLKFGDSITHRHHPLILNFRHEGTGIQSILFHGHKLTKKSNIPNLVLKYGDRDCFNLLQHAHIHTRRTLKVFEVDMLDSTAVDELRYRMTSVAPICNPGHYAESLGAASLPGFSIFEDNGRGGINHVDVGL